MSATTGMGDWRTISAIASAASLSLTVTRTMSQPASADWTICATVPATSEVLVFVMVCTEIGAPPPTLISPIVTWRVRRLTATLYVECWAEATSVARFTTGISIEGTRQLICLLASVRIFFSASVRLWYPSRLILSRMASTISWVTDCRPFAP